MDVLVVGAGSVGTWFAETVGGPVAFDDRDPAAAERAATAVDGRVVTESEEAFDLVCLAVPIDALETAAREHAGRARRAVVDVTGVMDRAVATLESVAPDRERVSLHPLFAPANAPGRIAVVPDAPGPTTEWLQERLVAAGNEPFDTTAAEHDRAMETVQAAAHAAILAYGLAAEDVPEAFHTPVSEPLTELVGQVAGGTPSVYADIQGAFEGADRVADAAGELAAADRDQFLALYDRIGESLDTSVDESADAVDGESLDADGTNDSRAADHDQVDEDR
jgi:prephenate dehydrogenase